jgi:hypothetical protein
VSRKPRWRAARRQEMRARGITPPLRWEVWRIRVSPLLSVPDWARQASICGLPCTANEVWLRPRRAKLLLCMDRARGGYSEFTKTEFRRCDLCDRPLVGSEAEKRRLSIEADSSGRALACGENCERDRKLGTWRILARRRAAASPAGSPSRADL